MPSTEAKQVRVLIMAGGTGGHVYPALATAEELLKAGAKVEWLGTHSGIEARLVPNADIKLNVIPVRGLRGKGVLTLLKAPFAVVAAVWAAIHVLKTYRPDVVLGMGGFASGPGGIAAKLLGVPLVIHEQNAVAGMTNRYLARVANTSLQAFEGAFADNANVPSVGNPVRGAILQLPEPDERYYGRAGPLRVLVVGGSLGAKAINLLMPKVLKSLPEYLKIEVWHQTGASTFDETQAAYQDAFDGQVPVRLAKFIDAMDEAYGWADLVICRSGALTVSELAIAGLPSILVPFPFAVDDHQTANGNYLERLGAGVVIDQAALTEDRLKDLLLAKFGQREQLLIMANKARQFGRPEASQVVANACLESVKL